MSKDAAERAQGREHVIDQIIYRGYLPGADGDYPMAPIWCSCGWSGVSREWQAHREPQRAAKLAGELERRKAREARRTGRKRDWRAGM